VLLPEVLVEAKISYEVESQGVAAPFLLPLSHKIEILFILPPLELSTVPICRRPSINTEWTKEEPLPVSSCSFSVDEVFLSFWWILYFVYLGHFFLDGDVTQ
jgi:hypothetical protein